mmetsp:Transcript_36722/g.109217  ORF Transcript_36722/g.109217 Transcript_36722/m.109217 type:complete len:379 (+) Transcript_36722:56-1192(+)
MHITVTRSLYLRRSGPLPTGSAAAALQSSARDPRERPPPPRAQNRHHSPSTLHAKISFSSDARHTAPWPGRGEGARALRHPSAGSPLGGAEAVRVGADPPPRVGAHLLEAELRLPPQFARREGRVRVHDRDVARPARRNLVREVVPAGGGEGPHHVEHRVSDARAEVVRDAAAALLQPEQGGGVPLGQVDHVDVVPHAGAVLGRVVRAVDGEVRPLPDRDLLDVGHQVVWDPLRRLADLARAVGADRVEVAEQDHVPALVRLVEVLQDVLDEELRASVRVGRARGEVLGDGHRRGVAVHSRGGGEDDALAVALLHRLDQVERACNVILVVEDRLRHALADSLEPSEVNHRVKLCALVLCAFEERVELFRLEQVDFHKL